MKLVWWLKALRAAIPEAVLWIWASCESHHSECFDRTGIRIVSIDSSVEAQARQTDIWEAIKLLQKYDHIRMRRVIRHISIIFLRQGGADGTLLGTQKVCLLNLTTLNLESSAHTRQIAIAGLLVHEATHGVINRLRIPYIGSLVKRIEELCEEEQNRSMNRLARVL